MGVPGVRGVCAIAGSIVHCSSVRARQYGRDHLVGVRRVCGDLGDIIRDYKMAWSNKMKAIGCSIVAVTIIIILSVVMVIGKTSSVSVQGPGAHVQEISEVKSALVEINNRVNFSGSVLILVVLIIVARATHHMAIKKTSKVLKRASKAEFELRVVKMKEILKSKGYLP